MCIELSRALNDSFRDEPIEELASYPFDIIGICESVETRKSAPRENVRLMMPSFYEN